MVVPPPPASRFVNELTITNLAAGATLVVAHGLRDDWSPITPNIVMPDRATPIVVLAVTSTSCTFQNQSSGAASAQFHVELQFSTQRDPRDTSTWYWKGLSGGGVFPYTHYEHGVAVFNGTQDDVTIAFGVAFADALYEFGAVLETDDVGVVAFKLNTLTINGFTITPAVPFTGKVSWWAGQ